MSGAAKISSTHTKEKEHPVHLCFFSATREGEAIGVRGQGIGRRPSLTRRRHGEEQEQTVGNDLDFAVLQVAAEEGGG